jgi:hypothetical protein
MLDVLRHSAMARAAMPPQRGIIDSQSVKAADTADRYTRGYEAGKKVSSHKRFIVTDTLTLLSTVTVCAASVRGPRRRHGTLLGLYLASPTCRVVFADAGFAGRLADLATQILPTTIHIVHKPADQKGFAMLPRIMWNLSGGSSGWAVLQPSGERFAGVKPV